MFIALHHGCHTDVDLHDFKSIIDVPPTTLRGQLVRNRVVERMCFTSSGVVKPNGKAGDHMTSSVAYLSHTMNVGGPDGRKANPCVRIKEPLDDLRKHDLLEVTHGLTPNVGAFLHVFMSILRFSDMSGFESEIERRISRRAAMLL